MSLFNFSIKGESFPSGKLESITRKFELELGNTIPVKSFSHTMHSITFLNRMETFAQLLNTNLYAVAAVADVTIECLRITVIGSIIQDTTAEKKSNNKSLSQINIAIDLKSNAENKILSALLIKARNKTQLLKNSRNTKINYAINSIIHLN